MDEVTVDPVQDDIEIVNEGEGTDAFAVSTVFLYMTHILTYREYTITLKVLNGCCSNTISKCVVQFQLQFQLQFQFNPLIGNLVTME